MRISIRMLKLDYWIVYRATFLSSHPISLFVLHVSNNLHDDPFHGHRNKKRFSSIEIRVHFMEMYPSVSAIIEIRSDILRNQDCRREREKTLISFSIRVRSTSPNSNTDGNHILRHHRYNFLNDAMESDIWLTRATTIRPDKSMKCSITNPVFDHDRVSPRLKHLIGNSRVTSRYITYTSRIKSPSDWFFIRSASKIHNHKSLPPLIFETIIFVGWQTWFNHQVFLLSLVRL